MEMYQGKGINQRVFGINNTPVIVSNHFNKSFSKLSLCFRTNCQTECLKPRERSKRNFEKTA
jgi:hypothetical protein